MPVDEAEIADAVERCANEMTDFLHELAARHGGGAILAALALHISSAIRLFTEKKICTKEQARKVVKSIERDAFNAHP